MKIVGTAIIVNDRQEILIGQRPEGKDLAGLWEFPGGKIEEGESKEEALVREIKEELNADIKVDDFALDSKTWGEGWQWDDDMNIHMPRFSSYNLGFKLFFNSICLLFFPLPEEELPSSPEETV